MLGPLRGDSFEVSLPSLPLVGPPGRLLPIFRECQALPAEVACPAFHFKRMHAALPPPAPITVGPAGLAEPPGTARTYGSADPSPTGPSRRVTPPAVAGQAIAAKRPMPVLGFKNVHALPACPAARALSLPTSHGSSRVWARCASASDCWEGAGRGMVPKMAGFV